MLYHESSCLEILIQKDKVFDMFDKPNKTLQNCYACLKSIFVYIYLVCSKPALSFFWAQRNKIVLFLLSKAFAFSL